MVRMSSINFSFQFFFKWLHFRRKEAGTFWLLTVAGLELQVLAAIANPVRKPLRPKRSRG